MANDRAGTLLNVLANLADVEQAPDKRVIVKDLAKRPMFGWIEVGFLVDVAVAEAVEPVVSVLPVCGIEGGAGPAAFNPFRECRKIWDNSGQSV